MLLLTDPRLGPFLRTVALVTASRGALPYFIIAIAARREMDGATLALLTVTFAASQAISSLLWGMLADRAGFRLVYRLGIATWILASLAVLLTRDPRIAVLLFLLLGAGLAGTMLCQSSMVLEFGHEGQRALHVAAASTVAEGCGTLGFVAAALLTRFASLETVFVAAAALQSLAWMQTRRLTEPRLEAPPLPRDG
jgi:MFS family permease